MSKPHSGELILDAITLEGFGSYISPARLEIKPFTILCGKNGSGKSTWLKALRLLKDSHRLGRLPYGFLFADWEPNNIQITNAFYHLVDQPLPFVATKIDENPTVAFPGSIGLELHYSPGQAAFSTAGSTIEAAMRFMATGSLDFPMKFKILIGHPTFRSDSTLTPHLKHVIALEINDCVGVRLVGERDPLQKFEDGKLRPRRSKPYMLQLGQKAETEEWMSSSMSYWDVATVPNLIEGQVLSLVDSFPPEQALQVFINLELRIQQLLDGILNTCFLLDSIRPHQNLTKMETKSVFRDAKLIDVGYYGEEAWRIALTQEKRSMGTFENFSFQPIDGEILERLFACEEVRMNFPKIAWIHSRLPEIARQSIGTLEPMREFDGAVVAGWFNALLESKELWNQSVWESVVDDDDESHSQRFIGNETLAKLVENGVDTFTEHDWRKLNYYSIIEAITEIGSEFVPSADICYLHEYLTTWLKKLVGVEYIASEYRTSTRVLAETLKSLKRRDPHKYFTKPTHFMDRDRLSGSAANNLFRLHNRCFGSENAETRQPPKQFPSAVHQVMPILVQLAVMSKNELLCIENPEVHLHPSLQVQLTEMLIDHVKSGRRILIETHSDLVLRRTIRALLQEEIPQSGVGIYCIGLGDKRLASSSGAEEIFVGSTLEPIRINKKGHISNWPEGFLDDDVRESQRLLDIMYGHSKENEGEE